jgi:hypothetical protein
MTLKRATPIYTGPTPTYVGPKVAISPTVKAFAKTAVPSIPISAPVITDPKPSAPLVLTQQPITTQPLPVPAKIPVAPTDRQALVTASEYRAPAYREPQRRAPVTPSEYRPPTYEEPHYEVATPAYEAPVSATISPISPVPATPVPIAAPTPASIVATTPAIAKPKGIVARILAWFGFVKAGSSVMAGEPQPSRIDSAGALVRRARNGDQNAMAIIDMARQNATRGNTQAKLAVAAILDYIKKNPVVSPFGNEQRDMSYETAVRLANGPLLYNSRIRQALKNSPFGADASTIKAFGYGLRNATKLPSISGLTLPHGLHPAMHAGKVVGLARQIQALRTPGTLISEFDPIVGWELGESK